MPLQATSGAASYDAFGGGVAAEPNYIESCFSTYLYTGAGTTQTINNGIDLAGKGGLVWAKSRAAGSHFLYDTSRGVNKYLMSNATDSQTTQADSLTAFNTTGFSIGNALFNDNAVNYASWTFRKQPKFFDVQTWTGNGVAGRQIAHSLGSAPGMIIVKNTSTSGIDWQVYHRSLGNGQAIFLNLTNAAQAFGAWNYTDPTATNFTVSGSGEVNGSSQTYVAYLFAHDAGGFGLTGTDNVISCGSYTANGNNTIELGYEPQWIMVRRTNTAGNDWEIYDTMRGCSLTGSKILVANTSGAEGVGGTIYPTATGFYNSSFGSGNIIYIAIRRGPMKVPTDGTKVYGAVTYSGDGTTGRKLNYCFSPDLALYQQREGNASYMNMFIDRLRGDTRQIQSWTSAAEGGFGNATVGVHLTTGPSKTIDIGVNGSYINASGSTYIMQGFGRAPSFFDEVCYLGTGVATTVAHNLGAVPELMIVKERNGANGWQVYSASLTNTDYLILNTSAAVPSPSTTRWNSTTPTSTVFSVGTHGATNGSGQNFVAYLFASCPGVSKVGSYTGTGTTLQIDCGFTGGARFVLIKRTDSTGSWYVWDSSRGIVSGNDPYLLLNSTAAEVTNTDYIDTYSAGFEISSTAPAEINASGGSFIFLAIS